MESRQLRTSAQRSLLSQRINKLVTALSDGVYEREDTIKLCLLAALSGESVFLLGPPGIAKSLIAKRLIQAFESNSYFEYLMTRFSTPEEVFGPLSIQELKDNGRYVRLTEGYLPTSQVVFLDEIWKAGPAILNTLLTVVNEKTFKNGHDIERVPMRLLIAASNELPDEESGLDALYDRLLVRVFVNRIQNKQNFRSMLTVGTDQEAQVSLELAIKDEEYFQWLKELDQLSLSEETFEQLYAIKSMIETKEKALGVQGQASNDLYISDRRWKKAVKLLKASAYFNGRDAINALDLLLLQDCLWNSPQSRLIIRECLADFATEQAYNQSALQSQMEQQQQQLAELNDGITQRFAMNLTQEVEGTLRRKNVYQYDISRAKRYRVSNSSDLVKLVLLQSNLSVSDHDTGDSRWVYIPYKELEQVVKDGGGEAYGYVNKKTTLCRFRFEVDVEQHLVIKDIANRNIPVTLVTPQGFDSRLIAEWQQKTQDVIQSLNHLEFDVRKARNEFHASLPHTFVDKSLLLAVESSIQELTQLSDSIKEQCEQAMEQVTRFEESFE
ncbi:ATPase RavA domain-containing protein [Vibrio aphrogenes]|uniref:ATPase RavA domain-containing protein n=1 Tax=Vibrio aphrogenes TaxID=1891186 RepID=UPI000B34E7E2|nr:ATPase RavA domain-containing protein [Vibrio aphrogenes]